MFDSNKKRLQRSKTFCLVPWTHIHTWPNGKVFPCCVASDKEAIGQLNENSSLAEIWNGPKYREMRMKMLSNEKIDACSRCYELEDAGIRSLRIDHNDRFSHHLDSVSKTTADGFVEKVNIVYFDFRFSNLCNFKCRTCGPDLSSGWYEDAVALGAPVPAKRIVRPLFENKTLWNDIEKQLENVEVIYFAGGEPLICEEHYLILQKLIEMKRFKVALTYNSNFSTLKYKNWDLLGMLSNFSSVTIGASLDAMGAKAEILRKGTVWEKVVENRERLLKEAPHIHFYVNFTLSAFNIFEAPLFHREWVEKGYIGIGDWNFNPVTDPPYYRTSAISTKTRQAAIESYKDHLDWIKSKVSSDHMIIGRWLAAIEWLSNEFDPEMAKKLLKTNKAVDKIRDEKIAKAFPELKLPRLGFWP